MFWRKNKKVRRRVLSVSDVYSIDTDEEKCFAIDMVVEIDGVKEDSILKSPLKSCLEDVNIGDTSYIYKI